jgi:hypothetical protein
MISQCWEKDPAARPTIFNLLPELRKQHLNGACSALHAAAATSQIQSIQALLQKGVSIEALGTLSRFIL